MDKHLLNFVLLLVVVSLITPAIGCGGGGGSTVTPPPPVTTYTLSATSSNPDTNLAVTASPADNSGKASGNTSLTLTYNSGTVVTLTAPATSGTNTFASWTGCTTASTTTCTVTLTSNTAVIASYTSPAVTSWNPTPVWSDEFNGAAGTVPDPAKWTYDTGNSGFGNSELECYTGSGGGNAYMDGSGNLVIEAKASPNFACPGGTTANYTSARMKTQGLFSQAYGRIEARIKLPYGQGIWPAFWMLGSNIDTVPWPACGEVDILENVTTAPLGPTTVLSSLHAPGFNTNGTPVDVGGNVNAAYHIYGMIWAPNMVQFYLDDYTKPFVTYTTTNMPQSGTWAFNHPFFIILNVAVGGTWPGPPDNTTFANPQKMYVDYVRVYNAN